MNVQNPVRFRITARLSYAPFRFVIENAFASQIVDSDDTGVVVEYAHDERLLGLSIAATLPRLATGERAFEVVRAS